MKLVAIRFIVLQLVIIRPKHIIIVRYEPIVNALIVIKELVVVDGSIELELIGKQLVRMSKQMADVEFEQVLAIDELVGMCQNLVLLIL